MGEKEITIAANQNKGAKYYGRRVGWNNRRYWIR